MEKNTMKGQNALPCDLAKTRFDFDIHLVQMKHI